MKNLKIDTEKIVKSYSGKTGCMCGCRGKYHHPKSNLKTLKVYEPWKEDPTIDRNGMAKKIAAMMLASPEKVETIHDNRNGVHVRILSVEENGRMSAIWVTE